MSPRFLTLAASVGALVVLQPYRLFVVSGTSMSPTFHDRQLVVGNARQGQVARGDVVVFRREGETMIKRVAYLPSDRMDQFFLFGEWRAAVNDLSYRSLASHGYPRRSFVVPSGKLYVIGDNVYDSVDSREYGPIDLSNVVAVVPGENPSEGSFFVGVHETSSAVASL